MKTKYIEKDGLNDKLLNEILKHLEVEGMVVSEIEEDPDVAKYIYHFHNTELKIEHKKFADLRYPQVLTALLESFLSQNKYRKKNNSIAIIEIGRPFDRHKTEAIRERVESFLHRYSADNLNWLILDANGKFAGRVLGRVVEGKDHAESYTDRSNKIIEKHSLQFSPTQQWLAKVLLLNGIDRKREHSLWPIKYNENIHDYKTLSKVSGVSESSCFNFIKLLESKDFLILDKYSYRFYNLDIFFRLWKSFSHSEKKEELFLTPKKPFGSLDKWQQDGIYDFENFCRHEKRGNFIMSGHLACKALGLDYSNNISSIIYTSNIHNEEFENFLSAMKLRPCEERNGEIRVILQKKEMPILKIDEVGNERSFFADPIQLMFDVEYLGGRGKEQSEFIYERVLMEHFRKNKWFN